MKRFMSFGAVGAVGFVADAAALTFLVRLFALDPYLARLISIAFALMVTWLLNRHWTFQPSRRGMALEGARYGTVGLGSSLVNFLVYSAILLLFPAVPALAAMVCASAAAMLLSFLGYSRLVFDR